MFGCFGHPDIIIGLILLYVNFVSIKLMKKLYKTYIQRSATISTPSTQCSAGASLHLLARGNSVHLCRQLEIDHLGSIYTKESGKFTNQGFCRVLFYFFQTIGLPAYRCLYLTYPPLVDKPSHWFLVYSACIFLEKSADMCLFSYFLFFLTQK